MKKILLTALIMMSFFLSAQTDVTQTDWSGGAGQATLTDLTKFNLSSQVDFSSFPGDINLIENNSNSFYGVAKYQNKIIIGTSYGNFIYNPLDNSWKHSYSGSFVLYHSTVHNGILYNLHGYNIYTYDGTENDYGFGENGWKFHSNIKSLGVTSSFTIESIDNELYLGARNGYSGRVLKWNNLTSSWNQVGQNFSNGVISLAKYNGVLYAGTHWSGQIFKLIGNSWTLVKSAGVMTVNDLLVFNNKLYATGWSSSYSSGKILSFDGVNWTTIYSGYGINKMTSDTNNIYFSARTSWSSSSGKILKYNGASTSVLYTLPSELYAFYLTSYNGDIYYGGHAGASTSAFYKNGQVLEKINGGYLFSSDMSNTSGNWGTLTYDATTSIRAGVSVILEGKKNDGTYGNRISYKNNKPIQLTENTMRYGVYFWSFLNASLPSMQEIRIGNSNNIDTTPPTVVTKPITVYLDATGNVSIAAEDIDGGSSDASGPVTLSLDAGQGHFTCANIGPNTVTLAVTDTNGITDTDTAIVTVVDNLGPTVLTKNIVLDLDAVGAATILPQDIDNGSSDNCAISSMSVSPNTFTCANMGDNTVTLTVTDVNGKVSTGTAVVTIVDNISPVVKPQNVTVYLDANGTASVTAAQVENGSTDNCSIASYSLSLPRGGTIDVTNISCADVGVHNVTLNVADPSGNTGSGTAQITVVDNIAPVISCPTDINAIATSAAGALVNYTTPVGTDNCTATTTLTAGLASGATFPIGTTVVTHTVTDASGLTATCSFNVTVVGVPPVIVCPADITVSNDPGLCGALVNYTAIETAGIPASTISYSIAPGSSFAVGTTAVTATATNAVGSSTCTFNVTVNDTEAPVVNVHPFTTTITNGVATVTESDVDNFSTDNCGIASMTVSPNTFVCGDQGNHVVTLTVTDIHGLTASQTTTVTVVGDVPVISINTFMAVPTQNTNTIYLGYGPQSMGLTTTTTGGTGFTYNWVSSTGELVAGVANPTISPLVSTTYTVTVTNANGCSATATTDVCVIDARAIDEDGEYEGKILVCKGSSDDDHDKDKDKDKGKDKDSDDDHGQKAKAVKQKDVEEYLEEGGTLGGCNATCTTTYVDVIVENDNDHADNDHDGDDNDHSDNKDDDKKDKDKSGRSNARTIIYPNPAVDEVVVSLDKKGEGTIEVYDYSGRIIFKKKVKNLKEGIKLNMRSKMSGSYFTRIIYKGKVYTAIIFKKK